MIAIDVHALRKSYGAVHALRGIDLTIQGRGQIVGLLGPNGAGKTTLVEILEGLRPATSGTVAVMGRDPVHAAGALRARLGVQRVHVVAGSGRRRGCREAGAAGHV